MKFKRQHNANRSYITFGYKPSHKIILHTKYQETNKQATKKANGESQIKFGEKVKIICKENPWDFYKSIKQWARKVNLTTAH